MSRRARAARSRNSEHARASRGQAVVDPAENYYERSRQVLKEYEAALNGGVIDSGYLAETNYEDAGRDGNHRSRQGFDPGTFRGI